MSDEQKGPGPDWNSGLPPFSYRRESYSTITHNGKTYWKFNSGFTEANSSDALANTFTNSGKKSNNQTSAGGWGAQNPTVVVNFPDSDNDKIPDSVDIDSGKIKETKKESVNRKISGLSSQKVVTNVNDRLYSKDYMYDIDTSIDFFIKGYALDANMLLFDYSLGSELEGFQSPDDETTNVVNPLPPGGTNNTVTPPQKEESSGYSSLFGISSNILDLLNDSQRDSIKLYNNFSDGLLKAIEEKLRTSKSLQNYNRYVDAFIANSESGTYSLIVEIEKEIYDSIKEIMVVPL